MCLDFGTPKTINFPFETNEKFISVGVPILKHITVINIRIHQECLCKVGKSYMKG